MFTNVIVMMLPETSGTDCGIKRKKLLQNKIKYIHTKKETKYQCAHRNYINIYALKYYEVLKIERYDAALSQFMCFGSAATLKTAIINHFSAASENVF